MSILSVVVSSPLLLKSLVSLLSLVFIFACHLTINELGYNGLSEKRQATIRTPKTLATKGKSLLLGFNVKRVLITEKKVLSVVWQDLFL